MSYSFTTDKIEVRSITEGRVPRYIVNGTAVISNKKQFYEFRKRKDGSIRTLREMFTDNCLKNIKEQSKHKRLFVDAEHELATAINIRSAIKGKVSDEDEKKVMLWLKNRELPLGKVNDVEITDDSMNVYTELNPSFRELDREHQMYFDSIWHSLENKFLNGISTNFVPTSFTTDEFGDTVIDDVDMLGFSYVGQPKEGHNIFEVAIRAIKEGVNMTEEETEDVKKTNESVELNKVQEELARLKNERDSLLKEKEAAKEADVEKQKQDQAKMISDLQKTVEDLKKAKEAEEVKQNELNSGKGVVTSKDKFAGGQDKTVPDDKFYKERLQEITKGHDETMDSRRNGKEPTINRTFEGFSELVNLQAKVNNPTAGMRFEHPADEGQARQLMMKDKNDIIAPNMSAVNE